MQVVRATCSRLARVSRNQQSLVTAACLPYRGGSDGHRPDTASSSASPSAALALATGAAFWALNCDERAFCAEARQTTDARILTKNFVADAAAIAAPSVVNISSISGGGLFMTGSAGSGFIITEVYFAGHYVLRM